MGENLKEYCIRYERRELISSGSQSKVWRRCSDGHEWKAVIYSRTGAQKCGCPVCAGKTPRRYS